MRQLNLKLLLDDLLHAITSDSFLKINKKMMDSDKVTDKESVTINEALSGHFLVLPKGMELQQKPKLKELFSTMSSKDVEKYELNYKMQDYLEEHGYKEVLWNLLKEDKVYAELDLSKHLSPQQLISLHFHQISNQSIHTKGYWFWRFYFDCNFLNRKTEIYRIYCTDWGNKFWTKTLKKAE